MVHLKYYKEPQSYEIILKRMQNFTDMRNEKTPDEIWFLEHHPVFTQGQAGKPEHVLKPGNIPVIQSDRGGQVTYHGPGQWVIYFLIDLKRKNINIKEFVNTIEEIIINFLKKFKIIATRKPGAPGVYYNNTKICALGLRVRRGCCYHGLSFNFNMDLEPFSRINPCGLINQAVTQFADLVNMKLYNTFELKKLLLNDLLEKFHYRELQYVEL